jgi:hypothetical protein
MPLTRQHPFHLARNTDYSKQLPIFNKSMFSGRSARD